MGRMVVDCRRMPSESNCSLTIIGEADEVVRAAAVHAADVHGHERSPEFEQTIRDNLEDESAWRANEPATMA
jgi:predicted small metal-binding protein